MWLYCFIFMKKPPKINLKDSRKNLPRILAILKKTYPGAKTALNFTTPLEMLVATILSAQCTDVRVNLVTPALFKKYRSCSDYIKAKPEELQKAIRSTGFYRNKTKSIQGACRVLKENFNGIMPRTMKDMLTLPGVARKTASVVLFNVYGVVEGIIVDTHMRRLSRRMGFSAEENPEKIEKDLMKITSRKDWAKLSFVMVDHGRKICKAVKPICGECPVNKLCPSAFAFDDKGKWIGVK
jgi:endonuclease III